MTLEAFGLAVGFTAGNSLKKEAELKQGKNDYLASLQTVQCISSTSSVASTIISQIPYAPLRIAASIGNNLLPFAGLIVMPASAAIKNGHYETGVKYFNALTELKCPSLSGILPDELDQKRVELFTYLSDNSSTISSVALAATTVALPFLGFGSLAACIAAPLLYHGLESHNLVPTSVSINLEKSMPTFVNVAMLAAGNPFGKLMAGVALSTTIPGASDYTQKKIQQVFLRNSEGITLEQIDAPWEEQNNLSFPQIEYILEYANHDLYEINPAACSKLIKPFSKPVDNVDFDHFLALSKKTDWTLHYKTLRNVFRDDDRFIDFLADEFPEIEKNAFKVNFEEYIEILGKEANQTKEQYLATQLEKQLSDFCAILKKEKAVKGFIYELEDAIESCSTILAYLLEKPVKETGIDIATQDILIKLAIEGGDYCARGIKRAASEIQTGICFQELAADNDPQKIYEFQILQKLQLLRQKIMQNSYQKIIEVMTKLAKYGENLNVTHQSQTTDETAVAIAQDVHIMDNYRVQLSLGFYPLTCNERALFGLPDFMTWSIYHPFRLKMYEEYNNQLDEPIKELGEANFYSFFTKKINSLKQLSEQEKEILIEKLVMCEEGEKTTQSFRRLFYVMLGILNVNWTPIEKEDEWTEMAGSSFTNAQLDQELECWLVVDEKK